MAISYGYDRERPRTRVVLDTNGLGASNVISEKPLVLLGSAIDGQPNVIHSVTNFAQAREIFRGGELLDAIELAWNPGQGLSGAGRIFAVRTDEATTAKVEEGGLKIESRLYGTDANSIQVELTNDALTGGKRFGVYFTRERYERVYGNIGNIFSVKYVGEEAQATIKIEKGENNRATRLILSVGDSEEELSPVRTYEIGTGVYGDVNVLVNDIHNLPDFEARMDSNGGNKNIETFYLDELDQNVKGSEATVTAVAGDLLNQTRNDRYVRLSVSLGQELPNTVQLKNLTGGETLPAPASWAEMFEKVMDVGAYYILPLTSNESIHSELGQFLRELHRDGDHIRGVVGGAVEESMEELRTRQMNLRNDRVSVVGNSVDRRMADGRFLSLPGYMYAAIVAGIASGLEIGEPITYKRVNIEGVHRKFTGDQLDQLNNSGIIMTEFVRTRQASYFRLVSDPTTYNVASEPVQNRMSLGEVSDFLTTELRTMLDEDFVGSRIRQTSASIMKNAVESFLDRQKNVGGLIVDYNSDDIQVVIDGNTARINITVQPAQGLDYINVYLSYEDNELTA